MRFRNREHAARMLAEQLTMYRGQHPLVLGIPRGAVAPPETVARMQAEADEVVCLYAPDSFYAVGHFFEDFSQVTDEQAIAILRESCAQAATSV